MAAKNIKGITIEIGGNTTKLESALKDVNKVVYSTNSELKQLNQALKLDPKNTELLAQKQDVLKKNIQATTERLNTLKEAQIQMGNYASLTEEQKEQYRGLSVEIAKGENALKNMNVELKNANSGKLDGINNEAEKVGNSFIKVGDIIKANLASEAIIRVFDSVANKIKEVTGAIGKMVVSGGIDRALNIENAKAKISTFTKSADQLDAIMKNVGDSVDGTAFSMDSAATVAAGLFAAGIKEGPEMEKSLRLVGDAAQVSGRSMEEIGSIFNKVAANGKLSGQELNQLSDSGIPVLQLLSQSLGKTTEEVRDMVSAGEIGFAEFSDAMEKGLGGAAQNAGQTFTSSLANLKSALSRMGAELMTPLLEGLTPVMNSVKDIIKKMVNGDDISGEMENLFKQLESFATTAVDHLTKMSDKYLPVINEMLQRLLEMIPQLLPKIVPLITSLFTNIAMVLLQNLPTLLNAVIQTIVQVAVAIADSLPTLIPAIVQCITQIVQVIVENLPTIIMAGIQILMALIEGIVNAIPDLVEMLPTIYETIITVLIDNLPMIIDAGIQLLIALIDGIIKALPQLIQITPKIIKTIVTTLIKNFPQILSAGMDIIKSLIDGMNKLTNNVWNATKQIISKLLEPIKGLPKQMLNYGKDMIQGMINGIKNMMGKVGDAAKGVADKIKNFLHFSKPDEGPLRDYETWMPDFMKGLAKGINKSSYLVENATESLADSMADKLSIDALVSDVDAAMRGLNAGIHSSVNPVINPNITYETNYKMMARAVKEALEDMAVEMDDDKFGKFIVKTVTDEVYN